jgi:hypothetical protein
MIERASEKEENEKKRKQEMEEKREKIAQFLASGNI